MTRPSPNGVDLYGHRGARGEVAENTLASIRHACDVGVVGIELDAGMTSDGVVVVCHDRRLNPALTRTSDGDWLAGPGPTIASLSFRQLESFDVGRLDPRTEYGQMFPDQRGADGLRIPTFEQVLMTAEQATAGRLELIVEVKVSPEAADETAPPETLVEALVDVIEQTDVSVDVVIESFDWRVMDTVEKLSPTTKTAFLTCAQSWFDTVVFAGGKAGLWTGGHVVRDHHGSVPDMVAAAGGRIWAPHFGDLNEAEVERAKALGLRIVVWTVNKLADVEHMMRLGVDGIITDYPSRWCEVSMVATTKR